MHTYYPLCFQLPNGDNFGILQENNRSEIERLDKERKADFINMLKGFVVNQVLSWYIKIARPVTQNCLLVLFCYASSHSYTPYLRIFHPSSSYPP